MIDFKNPDYFIALANYKNMRKAAEYLFVSQPTLSYYLNRLEQDAGCPLFYRHKNEMQLTTAGKLYLNAARQIISIRDDTQAAISRLNREANLYILFGSVWAGNVLSWVLPRLNEKFPDLHIETAFETAAAESILLHPTESVDGVDFSLCSFADDKLPGSCFEPLNREPVFFALPAEHPYLKKHPHAESITDKEITTEFQNETFVISRPKSSLHEVMLQLFTRCDAPLPKTCEVNGLGLTNNLIESIYGGYRVAFMPLSGISNTRSNAVRYLRIQPDCYRYNLLWHRESMEFTPPQELFLQLVREYFNMQHNAN